IRILSITEKLMPSPWLPSRRVVSYNSTSGFIISRVKKRAGICKASGPDWKGGTRETGLMESRRDETGKHGICVLLVAGWPLIYDLDKIVKHSDAFCDVKGNGTSIEARRPGGRSRLQEALDREEQPIFT